ncbi:NifU family protein [bacterium]|jgi:NifU-like protein|nr:NifU family protein [bacterium]
METGLAEKIERIFDEKLRPFIAKDGGSLELVRVEGNLVKVSMKGACGSCPSSLITLKSGIEATLKQEINSEIIVENVTQPLPKVFVGWGNY